MFLELTMVVRRGLVRTSFISALATGGGNVGSGIETAAGFRFRLEGDGFSDVSREVLDMLS
jgi:hypothetical protein